MRLPLLSVVSACLAATWVIAQEPSFDVASIRPSPSDSTQISDIRPTPFGRLTAVNATGRSLILRAYGLVDTQLSGAPAWLNSERYDIDARTTALPGGSDALLPLLRRLIIERFKLSAHQENRELQAYALTFARRDRQLGSLIRTTQTDCSKPTTMTQDDVRAAVRDGWPPCGMAYFVNFTTTGPNGNNVKMRVRRSGITMPALATGLQPIVDRPVIDQTGLEGRFDVEYSYAPQPPTPGAESVFGPDAPAISVALEEQLGLKLDSRRMSVPVLVIDSIERPSEN
jgi:uncharacterized protein (TIGR03435 family)